MVQSFIYNLRCRSVLLINQKNIEVDLKCFECYVKGTWNNKSTLKYRLRGVGGGVTHIISHLPDSKGEKSTQNLLFMHSSQNL